jgi:hypothetical protein
VRQERRQAVGPVHVEHPVGAPLADRRQVGDRHRQEVQDVRHRGAVEVAVRLEPAVLEQHRVVDRAGRLAGGDGPGVAQGVPGGAGHLRAQRSE